MTCEKNRCPFLSGNDIIFSGGTCVILMKHVKLRCECFIRVLDLTIQEGINYEFSNFPNLPPLSIPPPTRTGGGATRFSTPKPDLRLGWGCKRVLRLAPTRNHQTSARKGCAQWCLAPSIHAYSRNRHQNPPRCRFKRASTPHYAHKRKV